MPSPLETTAAQERLALDPRPAPPRDLGQLPPGQICGGTAEVEVELDRLRHAALLVRAPDRGRSPAFAIRSHVELERPSAARLIVQKPIRLGDVVRLQQAI